MSLSDVRKKLLKLSNQVGAVAMFVALGFSTAAAGQEPALTLQAVERKYPRMSEIHIEKCDKNGNGLYERGEIDCVSSLYSALYSSD